MRTLRCKQPQMGWWAIEYDANPPRDESPSDPRLRWQCCLAGDRLFGSICHEETAGNLAGRRGAGLCLPGLWGTDVHSAVAEVGRLFSLPHERGTDGGAGPASRNASSSATDCSAQAAAGRVYCIPPRRRPLRAASVVAGATPDRLPSAPPQGCHSPRSLVPKRRFGKKRSIPLRAPAVAFVFAVCPPG